MLRIRKHVPATPLKTVIAKTEEAFIKALEAINVHDRILYHSGFLFADADLYGAETEKEKKRRSTLRRFGNMIYRTYQEKRVYLVQAKQAKGCDYFAVKRSANR
jgi:hypothetical protein